MPYRGGKGNGGALHVGLTLKPPNVHFGPQEVKYLGHTLTVGGIRIGIGRVKSGVDLPTPKPIAAAVSSRQGELRTKVYTLAPPVASHHEERGYKRSCAALGSRARSSVRYIETFTHPGGRVPIPWFF